MEFPDDENGHVLRTMYQRGGDLSKPREVDFYFVFPTTEIAQAFAGEVGVKIGLTGSVAPYEERNLWEVTITNKMIPTHSAITALETSLTQLAKSYGGESDGWGSFKQ